jgi:hypothetical protein
VHRVIAQLSAKMDVQQIMEMLVVIEGDKKADQEEQKTTKQMQKPEKK